MVSEFSSIFYEFVKQYTQLELQKFVISKNTLVIIYGYCLSAKLFNISNSSSSVLYSAGQDLRQKNITRKTRKPIRYMDHTEIQVACHLIIKSILFHALSVFSFSFAMNAS